MAEDVKQAAGAVPVVSQEQLRQAEAYIEAEEGVVNRLFGWAGTSVTVIAVVMTLFHLYAAYDIVPTQPLRYTHVAFVMVLCFLSFPVAAFFSATLLIIGLSSGTLSSAVSEGTLMGLNHETGAGSSTDSRRSRARIPTSALMTRVSMP